MTPWEEFLAKIAQPEVTMPPQSTPVDPKSILGGGSKEAEKGFDWEKFMSKDGMGNGMMVALASGLLPMTQKPKLQAQAWGNQGSARPYKPMFQGERGGDFKSILAMLMRGR